MPRLAGQRIPARSPFYSSYVHEFRGLPSDAAGHRNGLPRPPPRVNAVHVPPPSQPVCRTHHRPPTPVQDVRVDHRCPFGWRAWPKVFGPAVSARGAPHRGGVQPGGLAPLRQTASVSR